MRATLKQLDLADQVKRENRCPDTVGFRLDTEEGEILAARAKTLGVSAHVLARFYTVMALRERDEKVELRDAITKLHKELGEIRKDVIISAEVLLSSAGKIEPDDARAWVDKHLGAS